MSLTPARRQLELAVQFLILQQCHRLPGVRCARSMKDEAQRHGQYLTVRPSPPVRQVHI